MMFCIGLEVETDEEAFNIFVDVLWHRHRGQDDQATSILKQFQCTLLDREVCYRILVIIFRQTLLCVNQVRSPPKLNLFVAEEDSDVGSDSDSESTGSDYDDYGMRYSGLRTLQNLLK